MDGTSRSLTNVADGLEGALVEIGAITHDQLASAAQKAGAKGWTVSEHLLNDGAITRADIIQASIRMGMRATATRMADLPEWSVILNDVGQSVGGSARDNAFAVIALESDRVRRCFMVITDGVTKVKAQGMVAKLIPCGYQMAGVIQSTSELMELLYADWDARRAQKESGDTSLSDIQRDFDEMAVDAITMGASDIHISAKGGAGAIHLRIHGELEHYQDLTDQRVRDLCSSIYNTLVEVGSTKDGFNPAKNQDGVIERNLPVGRVRFRYSGVPLAPSGFDVTLRIIPIGVTTRRKEMHELGYSPDQCVMLERIFANASGLILFAGTTGSGKSTSMANCLRKLAEERPGKKIRTVEEPVEYRIDGVYQTPVVRLKGDKSDFLETLRQLMRSDPDVIGVGEIRDSDTADLAIQAVRSGHLCISTIHADGAPICYDRLSGMGISRTDIASVGLVAGLIYQKLLPVLCPDCKIPAESFFGRSDAKHAGVASRLAKVVGTFEGIYCRNPAGCHACNSRGIIGRTVCAEILRPNTRMLKAIAQNDSPELKRLWRETASEDIFDMTGRSSFEHALSKMLLGYVCPLAIEAEYHFLDDRLHEGDDA